MNRKNLCSKCGTGRLKSWSELSEDEQQVVERLPASGDYSLEERQQTHRWCTRCWDESRDNEMTV